jgi:predicted helicase
MSEFAINQYLKEVERVIHFGGTTKETSIRNAFHNLLNTYASRKGLMVVPEITIKTAAGKNVTPDGTIKDSLRQDWGYWESKDESDIIDEEISKKFAKGYPKDNILFEDSKTAVLIQNGNEVLRVKFSDVSGLDHLLNEFVNFEPPRVTSFRKAIELFKADIPKVTDTIRDLLDVQEKENPMFVKERNKFLKLCQESINPDVTKADVREMIIQHILTEDIFNTIFDETQFHRENNVARQLEGVIHTFFTGATKKTALATLQHYSQAINAAAAGIADHHEKQKFLKVVYETFYKSYNPKAADRLGVVYTPNEIVKFMIESTDYLLHKHFGKYLEDKGVEILDPATGTGTFVCDIIDYIRKEKLEYKYKNEIHANEVAILPYYISNLNIEFTYNQKMGKYSEFENLCFVDTLDNMGFAYRGKQIDLFEPFTEENSKRIYKQNTKKISVVIGNPPYNANQANESDDNKNREYPLIDKRIKDTFIKYSTAQKTKVYDMYARFYRWAMDRLEDRGVICFITNNSFVNSRTFDGFRKVVQDEFEYAYIIDLGGNITELSGKDGIFLNEKNTIFGRAAAVGIAMMFLIKDRTTKRKDGHCRIHYIHPTDIRATRDEKLAYLADNPFKDIPFDHIQPDKRNNWINLTDNDFESLLPIADKAVKQGKSKKALFELFSLGVVTNRDEWVYDFDAAQLNEKLAYFKNTFNNDLKKKAQSKSIKYTRELKRRFEKGIELDIQKKNIIVSLYRPYVKTQFYFNRDLNEMQYQIPSIFYSQKLDNKVIILNNSANRRPYTCLAANLVFNNNFNGDPMECLPFYRYDELGNRSENITDWGLNQFQKQYGKKGIDKESIFHYVYAVLHNPAYLKKYELNLKREFPRIPFYSDFKKWSDWGKTLMDLHINYETLKPFGLREISAKEIENPKCKLKADKEAGTIILNDETTLTGVPTEAWNYKLGNRSALEWVLDQYKEKKPSDPTILEKFNTYKFADYKDHVIDLLKRVCTVSVETMKIIREMEASNE